MKNSDLLDEYISQGEHQRQDFKYEISSIRKIAKTVSAFANTDGGRLLVGVRDNGSIAGIRSEEEIFMIEAAAESECHPKALCEMEVVRAKGKNVLIANILKSPSPPVRCKDDDGKLKAYVRVGDETVLATAVHMYLWEKMRKDKGSMLSLTEDMRKYLRLLDNNGMTLGRFCKASGLSRHAAVRLLGDLVDFGLVKIKYSNHTFEFHNCDSF